jgi:hypothetical protein
MEMFDAKQFQSMVQNGMDNAARYQETARKLMESQLTTAQSLATDAVNRYFDAVRETARVMEAACSTGAEHVKKACEKIPGMSA